MPSRTLRFFLRVLRGQNLLIDSQHEPCPVDSVIYCAVSVNVTTGCPSAYCPSTVTCTTPAVAGNVSTTAAFPDESVVTMRLGSDPALAVNKIVPPAALPPDCPALSVTERLNLLPTAPF